MAVANLLKSQLRLHFENGTNPETGDIIFKAKLFNNVKLSADAEQLYTVAQALAGLQQLPLHEIERNDSSEITPF